MAKFKFRLQSYLGVKEKIEEQKKLEYGKAVRKVEEEKRTKDAYETETAAQLGEMRAEMAGRVSPEKFIQYKQYITHLERQIIRQEAEIKRAEKHAESKRIELLGAVKQRKMVDVLKEHKYTEYLEEEKIAEQKIVDEIVSFRFGNYDKSQ